MDRTPLGKTKLLLEVVLVGQQGAVFPLVLIKILHPSAVTAALQEKASFG